MRVPITWLSEYIKLPDKLSVLTDKFTMVGHMLDKIDKVNGNEVIDLELRGNRADLVGIVGIAKEGAAVLKTKYKRSQTVALPKTDKNCSLIKVLPETEDLVKRYLAFKVSVEIKKSPKFIIDRLNEYGIPSFNNVIDITNYVMVETGHPMHAFDLSKLTGGKLIIRMAKEGERFETIQQGTTLTLSKKDLAIADENKVQCLNIIGGFDSRVTDETNEIIIESAVYDPGNCRRTGRRLKTLTEGGSRHEKLQDPNGVTFALERALFLLQKYANGKATSLVSDYYPKTVKPWIIDLNYQYLYSLSGVEISNLEVQNILISLGFKIVKTTKEKLSVEVPTDRTDVRLEEDLVEEVIRIYGYDKIPVKTLSLEIPKNITPSYILQEEKLRASAVSVGFDECISLSFIREKYKNGNIELVNPPSPDTKYLRNSLFYNLLDSAQKIINERGELVQLFEIGKIYLKDKKGYVEKRKIGFIYWSKKSNNFVDFKSLISALFDKAGIKNPEYISEIINFDFVNSYLLKLDKKEIGFGGKHNDLYYTEIDLDSILGIDKKYEVDLWPKYPPQIEDITLIIPEKTYIGEVIKLVYSISYLVYRVELTDIFENNYTFNVQYQSNDHTLTDKEVEEIRSKILSSLKTKFGISIKE